MTNNGHIGTNTKDPSAAKREEPVLVYLYVSELQAVITPIIGLSMNPVMKYFLIEFMVLKNPNDNLVVFQDFKFTIMVK
jgi:hypothetical protein